MTVSLHKPQKIVIYFRDLRIRNPQFLYSSNHILKRTVPHAFRFQVFSRISFPLKMKVKSEM